MEQTYAVLNDQNIVVNLIIWDGDTENWQPPEGCTAVPVGEGVYVSMGYTYDGAGGFIAPPAPPVPPPTAPEVLALRDTLLAEAAIRIAPLQDAVDLDDATPAEIAALKAWKQYRVALNRIEQQAGFPASVNWPVKPE